MADTTTLNETTRSPIDGTEAVRLATTGANWKATVSALATYTMGNAFVQFGGPTTSAKTFTLPDASATILTTNAVVTVAQGGSGAATFTAHGVLVGEGTSAFVALSVGATGTLLAGTTGANPAFSATPTLGANGGTGGAITLNGATSGSVAVQVAAAAGTGTVFQLPATNGTSGYVLQTNGSGITSWVAAAGGAAPFVASYGGSGANNALAAFALSGGYSVGIYNPANYTIQFSMSSSSAGDPSAAAYTGLQYEMSSGVLSFGLTNQDIVLNRDAANILGMHNSTNAQTIRIYNTFTDASNYERLTLDWNATANVCYIKNQNAGTGSARIMVPVTGSTTVAGLPAASTAGAGARAFVTDATATTFLSTVSGTGSNKVPVVSDGTNWLIG